MPSADTLGTLTDMFRQDVQLAQQNRLHGDVSLGHAAQIEAGSYTNDSEAIRDLIRREQERGFEIESIRQALIEGEQSGEPEPNRFIVNPIHQMPGLNT